MAKHAHKLILMNGKTWKCALPGCTFFVHLGLAHVLINRPAKCWKCDEEFNADESSLSTGKSVCFDCNLIKTDGVSIEETVDARFALVKEKVKHINEVQHIGIFQMKYQLSDEQIQYLKDIPTESNQSNTVHQSVDETEHTSDCAFACFGMECDCKIGGM